VSCFVGTSQGNVDGIGTNVMLNFPSGVTISPDETYALVVDRSNHLIRKIVMSTRQVYGFAGGGLSGNVNGIGTNARFNSPGGGISLSSDGLYALIADTSNHLIRLLVITTGEVSTLVGSRMFFSDGVGTNAFFYSPSGVSISSDNSFALVADTNNYVIRKISLSMILPTPQPTTFPSLTPSSIPSHCPSILLTFAPSVSPTFAPSVSPTSLLPPL
jgi:DNA-binding beta-propeller fold protein YncE